MNCVCGGTQIFGLQHHVCKRRGGQLFYLIWAVATFNTSLFPSGHMGLWISDGQISAELQTALSSGWKEHRELGRSPNGMCLAF